MNQQIKTIFLLGALSALLVGLGSLLGSGYLYGFLALALVLNVGTYFFSDKIVLKMYRAQEVSERDAPWLHATVSELAQSAGIPKPKVCLIPDETPNAFATGRNPSKGVVAVTKGIQRVLSQRELRGVLAHEIAHIKNRDTLIATIAAVIATAISYIGNIFQWSAFFGGGSQDEDREGSPAMGLVMAFLAPVLAMLIQFGISRSREYFADQAGAQISGDPEALARALQKLESASQAVSQNQEEHQSGIPAATSSLFIINPFAGAEGMMRLFSTHPSTQERIKRLEKMMYSHLAA